MRNQTRDAAVLLGDDDDDPPPHAFAMINRSSCLSPHCIGVVLASRHDYQYGVAHVAR